jgi:mRNA interferase RelE/StbE
MYEVVFDVQALGFLEKLERPIARRIWKKLMSCKENPKRYFERLVGREDYKLKVGDYRVLADIDDTLRRIEITRIGHRKNIYDKS